MKRVLVFLVMLLALITVTYTWVKNIRPKVTMEADQMHLLKDVTGFGTYTLSDETNRMFCDLATFSYLIQKMQEDGYVLEDLEESEDFIEVRLDKDEIILRMRYTDKGDFICFCKVYEKSYIPMTYLNEEK